MKADTSANWTTAGNNGFVPLKNEAIFYADIGRFKLGNGINTVTELDFFEQNINYDDELAFDTSEIVIGATSTTTSVLGQAILGQMVLA
jgi:hypothetical protein